ncbi:MAG: cell division protein FtsQ/DivIB [Clostridium sp.]|nr:cell division protein FtsQ/DivIB [Clostridium sp.]
MFILVIIALLGGTLFFIVSHYTIREVYVEGNLHYTKEEIMAYVMKGPKGLSFLGNNSLYLASEHDAKSRSEIPFVDRVEVEIISSDTIKIRVYEKALSGYVKYLDGYMYFDKDGYVVESSKQMTAGVPLIVGLSFSHIVLGERLPIEDEMVFERIMRITSLLSKYELTADRINLQSSGAITLYFGSIQAQVGSGANLEDKFMRLPQILPLFEGQAGTLHMENIDDLNPDATFTPD